MYHFCLLSRPDSSGLCVGYRLLGLTTELLTWRRWCVVDWFEFTCEMSEMMVGTLACLLLMTMVVV